MIKFTSEYYISTYSQSLDSIISSNLIPQTEKQIIFKEENKNNSDEILKSLNSESTRNVLQTLFKCRKSTAKYTIRSLLKITSKQLNKELNSLKKLNLIDINFIYSELDLEKKQKDPLDNFDVNKDSELNKLSSEQENAYLQIKDASKNKINKFLIHGVTGSGKTEVYFKLIQDTLLEEKSVILLVPEIALAPQLIERLKKKFPAEDIIVWHSALETSERQHSFLKLLENKARIVVGARSAVFSPVHNLGLIIIDEEHENSYKQDQPAPRYHTRKISEYRCEKNNAMLVLGSATPSLETYYKASSEKHPDWILLTLKQRYNANPLPEVELVDMREEFNHGNKSIFSKKLKALLETTLEKKSKAFYF